MTLIDLINHVGLENVTLQPLERDLHGLDTSKKHGCTIVKFGTKALTPGDIVTDNPKRKVGFVLWIPKERIPVIETSVGARDGSTATGASFPNPSSSASVAQEEGAG